MLTPIGDERDMDEEERGNVAAIIDGDPTMTGMNDLAGMANLKFDQSVRLNKDERS